jgi:hypothetical protein
MASKIALPNEIWSEIFRFCDANSLVGDLPIVCQLFAKLTDSNELWKCKCTQRGLDLALKMTKSTWKQFYFFQHLELFPLYGIEIGKTTEKELEGIEGAKLNETRYAVVEGVNFWYNNSERIFKMMYLVRGIYILPKAWEQLGLYYDHSWNSLLIYLREYNHNYQILKEPHESTFQNRTCFSATVQTICKYKNVHYSITFAFDYAVGNENSKGTLYSISLNCSNSGTQEREWRKCYEQNVFTNLKYVMENEEQVRLNLDKELSIIAPKLGHRVKVPKKKPTVIPLVTAGEIQVPNDIWRIILRNTEAKTLAITVPHICRSLHVLSNEDKLWEDKCLQIGRDPKGIRVDETWKRYYFIKSAELFPLFGCVIDVTTAKELIERADATRAAQDKYVTINKVNFWFNNTEEVFKMMYIVRGIYPMPEKWLDLGMTFEMSYVDYLKFFKTRFGNYQVVHPPSQKNHSFLQKKSFDATVNVIGRHNDVYYMVTIMFGYTPGNTRSPNTLYSISLRGAYNTSETNEWTMLFEDHNITHKEPVEDPDEPDDNPTYGQPEEEDLFNEDDNAVEEPNPYEGAEDTVQYPQPFVDEPNDENYLLGMMMEVDDEENISLGMTVTDTKTACPIDAQHEDKDEESDENFGGLFD